MKRMYFRKIILVFSLILVGCNSAAPSDKSGSGEENTATTVSDEIASVSTEQNTPTSSATEKPIEFQATPVLDPSILYTDDFSDPESGWEAAEFSGGTAGYQDETYLISSNGLSTDTGEALLVWGELQVDQEFEDFVVEVTTVQLYAPENNNNGYGIICRRSGEDLGSGYLFMISGDGYYTLLKLENGGTNELVIWTSSSEILTDDAINQIQVTCEGNHLSMSVNGEMLVDYEDLSFSSGSVALAVVSFESTPTVIQFDDLTIRLP
jgi:hypothetical protein